MHGRFLQFDLLRFVAALIVFIGHLSLYIPLNFNLEIINILLLPTTMGALAVDFFFVLSGYVLFLSLLKYDGRPQVNWIFNRLFRLLPIYWFGLFLGIFVHVVYVVRGDGIVDILNVLASFLGIQVLWSDYALSYNSPLWTLSVELIVTPIIFLSYLYRRWIKVQLLISISIGMVFLDNPILSSIPFFILGSTLAFEVKSKVKFHSSSSIWRTWPLQLLIFAALFNFVEKQKLVLYFSELIVFAMIFILFGEIRLRKFEILVASSLGKRSYVIYAVHAPIISFVGSWLKPNSISVNIQFIFIVVISTIVATEIAYRAIEVPVLKHLSKKRQR
jgi:peptidoglycan/LPS O-acetylase OafA/YrhL